MTNIIDINKKGKGKAKASPVSFTSLSRNKTPAKKRSPEEIKELNEKTVNKLIEELETTLQEFITYDKSSDAYIAKIRGDFAARIHYYGLDKKIFKYFMSKGLYFHFKYVRVDDWNMYGKVTLLWDVDYSRLKNRIYRHFQSFFNQPMINRIG